MLAIHKSNGSENWSNKEKVKLQVLIDFCFFDREIEGERKLKGEIREIEVKGRGIERKRIFLLQFLIKYPERRSGKQG